MVDLVCRESEENVSDTFIDRLRKMNRTQAKHSFEDATPEDIAWARAFYEENKPRFEYAVSVRKRELAVVACLSFDRHLCEGCGEGGITFQYRLRGKMRALQLLLKSEEFQTSVLALPVTREGNDAHSYLHGNAPGESYQVNGQFDPRLLAVPSLSTLRDNDEPDIDCIQLIASW